MGKVHIFGSYFEVELIDDDVTRNKYMKLTTKMQNRAEVQVCFMLTAFIDDVIRYANWNIINI